MSAVML